MSDPVPNVLGVMEKQLAERQRGILGGWPDQWRFGLDRLEPEPAPRPFVELSRVEGRVLGVRFHPGGCRPSPHASVAAITGRRLDIEEAFGEQGNELDRAACGAQDGADMVMLIEEFPVGTAPDPDPVGERAAEIVRLIAHFTRDFTAAAGTSPARYARGVAGRRDALPPLGVDGHDLPAG